jgi:hypothetical protein
MMELFMSNEEGLRNHYFIPAKEREQECVVCEGSKSEHIPGDDKEILELWSQEVEQNDIMSIDN